MGVSGAGKSTLLHLLGGLESADHGSIQAGQFDISNARSSALASFRNSRIGFVFQFHNLISELSAVENVALPLMIARVSSSSARARASSSLEETGLGSRISHPVAHLSGGEQQRVAVCRALINEPSLVLADEPTGNLDTAIGKEIGQSLLSYARRRGSIVIVATHNERMAQLCDRILLLKDGRIH
jgi:lipoprotein-releasing system ATP-binding protein